MQSTTLINLNLQYPNYATTMHAVQNDKLTRVVTANMFDGSTPFVPDENALAMVRFHKPDNTNGFYDKDENNEDAVTWSGNVATIKLAEQALTCAGIVLCQIQFYKESGERLTTFTFRIDVQECAISDDAIMSTDYYSVLSTQISAALSITYRPPYIDNDTGEWMVWSVQTNQYEDSGYSAAGTQGEQGETGPAGASMESLTKISGTGEPGSTDTYRVNLTDGTYGGTFDVYNGQDGSGSPGSSTPLMDGTASAGTANAYSRQDHVHPSDTSKVDVVSGKGLSSNDFTDALKTKLEDLEGNASDDTPLMDGTADAGESGDYSRSDHVHPSDTSRQIKNVYHTNVSVLSASWYSDATYSAFPYRAVIPLANVTASMMAEVVFAPDQALSGDYAPVCETYAGGVYIWSKLNSAVTIPTIVIMG